MQTGILCKGYWNFDCYIGRCINQNHQIEPLKPHPFDCVDEFCGHLNLSVFGINELEMGGIPEGQNHELK